MLSRAAQRLLLHKRTTNTFLNPGNNRRSSLLLPSQAVRNFSMPGGGPPGGGSKNEDDGYVSDDENRDFESDRRFSNFVLFAGCLALGAILMASNVKSQKRKQ